MSAFAISGLAHCENYSPKEETENKPHPLAIPRHTVHIRVRVGRYRESQQATVNGGQVRVVEGELQTTTAIHGLFDKTDSEHFLSKVPTQFTIGSRRSSPETFTYTPEAILEEAISILLRMSQLNSIYQAYLLANSMHTGTQTLLLPKQSLLGVMQLSST